MKKKIIIAVVVAVMVSAFFVLPHVSFAQSGTYEEAVSNFNAATQNLNTQVDLLKGKMGTVKSLSEGVHKILVEKKKNGEQISDATKADLKKLTAIRRAAKKERDIREARTFYSKDIMKRMKNLKGEMKQKKENGATKEELKPLFKQMKGLVGKLKNVTPFSPIRMSEDSAKVLKKAADLKTNNKEKFAIKLLDGAAKKYNKSAEFIKNRMSKMDELIDLLTKVKQELGA